jgi:hypothetical protein
VSDDSDEEKKQNESQNKEFEMKRLEMKLKNGPIRARKFSIFAESIKSNHSIHIFNSVNEREPT